MSKDLSNKKIYCGVDHLKSNQRLGSAKECAELKQVRYYGLQKIKKNIIDEFKGISVVSSQKEQKLYRMFGKTKAEIQLLKNELTDYKKEHNYKTLYKKEIKILEDKIKKKKEELTKIIEKMNKLDKLNNVDEKSSKKILKKSDNKSSKQDSKNKSKKKSKKNDKKK
jgi:hypothetical protein